MNHSYGQKALEYRKSYLFELASHIYINKYIHTYAVKHKLL